MHPSWIMIDVKFKFFQMLPVAVAHHVKMLTISFLIVINIQIIGKYYLIVLIGYLLTLNLMYIKDSKRFTIV